MRFLSLLLFGAALAAGQTCEIGEMASNGNVDGSLAETDCTVRDYLRSETSNFKADAWKLTLRERLVLRLRMTSTEVDPYVYLLSDRGVLLARNDNFSTGKNSEINIQLPAGTYTVVAGSAAVGLGTYQVTSSTRLAKSCTPQELSLTGEALEADLTDNDCSGVDLATLSTDGNLVDVYRIEVTRSSILRVLMTSTTLDTLLSLYDSEGRRVAQDNNSGGGTNARLWISVPAGTYTVRAGVNRAATGTYRITATAEARRSCEPVSLLPGEKIEGQLTSSDCRLFDLFLYMTWPGPVDEYKFEVKERSVLKIRQESLLLDSYLILTDQNRRVLAENDDFSRDIVDSEVYISLRPGTYSLIAMELYGDIGKYTVSLDEEKLRSCPATTVDAPGTAAGNLTADGCRVMDLYSPSTSTTPAAKFSLRVAERAWTTVSAAGTGLAPLLDVVLPDGSPIGIDGPVTERSTLLVPGTYTVEVSTRNRGTGEFTLTTTTRPPAVCEPAALKLGEALNGELTATDCAQAEILPFMTTTARADLYKFEVEAAGKMKADVTTEGAVPYAMVLDAELKPVAFDLNLAFSPSSRVEWQGKPGPYYLLVSTYTGPSLYTVRLASDTGATAQ